MLVIGPLILSAFLEGQGLGQILQRRSLLGLTRLQLIATHQAGGLLDFVSFGSNSVLSSLQMEEMAQGVLGAGQPFSWLLRRDKEEEGEGMVVPWKEMRSRGAWNWEWEMERRERKLGGMPRSGRVWHEKLP
ncbi:hypothetical protein NL676_021648 [Syzygium grande]|nr:hypothetical protein NL676_021648 [Syzygium grande]